MPVERSRKLFRPLKVLIEAWCDRRAVKPLASILPPYVAFNGQEDSWRGILKALIDIQSSDTGEFPKGENDTVKELIRDITLHVRR